MNKIFKFYKPISYGSFAGCRSNWGKGMYNSGHTFKILPRILPIKTVGNNRNKVHLIGFGPE